MIPAEPASRCFGRRVRQDNPVFKTISIQRPAMNDTPIGPRAAELDAATRCYHKYLRPASLFDFDISALDRLGRSVVVASLAAPDGFCNDGFGYGANAEEARVGALGEMSETFHVHRTLERAPACEGLSYDQMIGHFSAAAVLDPLTLCLPAGSDYASDTPLRWVQVTRWPDGEPAWAPRECIAPGKASYVTRSTQVVVESARAPALLFTPITCGLGAGLSIEQALAHGVLELLQRDGNCTRFRAMDQGIDLALDRVDDPGLNALLAGLADQGLNIRPKLASTEFGLVNLYVIAEPAPGAEDADMDFALRLTACGEAVHANRERALRKAVLEYIAARVRKAFMHGPLAPIRALAPAAYNNIVMAPLDPADEEPRALGEMVDWLNKSPEQLRELLSASVFASREQRLFSSLPSIEDAAVSDPVERMADLYRRLGDAALSIYYLDATPAGADAPRVVKTIVPGLEGETLSYHRIGERGVRRLRVECPEMVQMQAPQAGAPRIRLTEQAEERLGGPAYFNARVAATIVGALYPLYREPGSHTAQKEKAGKATD